nr:Arginine ABC transporter [Raoultella sp. NCTC 9187]
MKKTIHKLSRRVAVGIAIAACFSPLTQAAELLTDGVFKVGMEVTYPPFESYDSNNNIVGLDPEFAALIAEHLKAKPQLIDTKFTSLILGIGKKYDAVISGMYITPERLKQADAVPYALSGASIIALKSGEIQPKRKTSCAASRWGCSRAPAGSPA